MDFNQDNDPETLWPGTGTEVSETPEGRALSVRTGGGFRHPWQVTPAWDDPGQRWVASVKAGLVNGKAPTIRVSTNGQIEEAPIYRSPAIQLPWRAIGFDGSNATEGDGVPQYFLNLGAAAAADTDEAAQNLDPGALVSALTPPQGLRLLRVCELWIHQPRLALTSTVTIFGDAIVTGLEQYSQTLSVQTPAPNDSLHLESGDFATAGQPALDGGLNVVNDDFAEPTFDLLPIARVYALSPPDTALGTDPDNAWSIFVSHLQFWNLAYVPAASKLAPIDDGGFQIFVPLAGGVAQVIVNTFTSAIDQANARVINELTAQSLAGSFYTPTGGGSTSLFPAAAAAPATGKTGADKTGRLQAQQQQAKLAAAQVRLEAPFPWACVAFPPALFKLGR